MDKRELELFMMISRRRRLAMQLRMSNSRRSERNLIGVSKRMKKRKKYVILLDKLEGTWREEKKYVNTIRGLRRNCIRTKVWAKDERE